ncbi:hypothetical protein ACP70R_026112 [Stipagrostis hirtigluma subsp. patula]
MAKTSYVVLMLMAMVLLASSSSGMDPDYPPDYDCYKIIDPGHCDLDRCQPSCSNQYKGSAKCVAEGCKCSYFCLPAPSPATIELIG